MVLANPKVSICIFSQGFTDETFLSAKNLAFDANLLPDFEVIIVCDESGLDDWAKTVLSAFNLDLHVATFPLTGSVSAKGFAASQARGDVLIFCNSQVVLTVDAVLQCSSVAAGEIAVPRILPIDGNNRVAQFFSEFVLNPCFESGDDFAELAFWAAPKSDFLEVARLYQPGGNHGDEDRAFLTNWITSGRALRYLDTARVFLLIPTSTRALVELATRAGRQSLLSATVGMRFGKRQGLNRSSEQVFSPQANNRRKSLRILAIKSTGYARRLRRSERKAHLARRLVTWPAVIAADVIARFIRKVAIQGGQSLRESHLHRSLLACVWFVAWSYGFAQGAWKRANRSSQSVSSKKRR